MQTSLSSHCFERDAQLGTFIKNRPLTPCCSTTLYVLQNQEMVTAGQCKGDTQELENKLADLQEEVRGRVGVWAGCGVVREAGLGKQSSSQGTSHEQ